MLSLIKSKRTQKEGGGSKSGGGGGGGESGTSGIFGGGGGGGIIGIRTGGGSVNSGGQTTGGSRNSSTVENRNSGEIVYSYEPSVGLGLGGASDGLVDLQGLPPPPPLSILEGVGDGIAVGSGERHRSSRTSMDYTSQLQQPPALPARNHEQQQQQLHSQGSLHGGGAGVIDRPPSRGGGERPPSRGERPSSRNSNSRNRQPRMGMSGVGTTGAQSYAMEDDPGIMSEIETSSTRFRKTQTRGERGGSGGGGGVAGSGGKSGGSKADKSSRSMRLRTTPNQVPRGYSLTGGGAPITSSSGKSRNSSSSSGHQHHHHHHYQQYYPVLGAGDDDSGIMSEAETSSTTRSSSSSSKRRSRSSGPLRHMSSSSASYKNAVSSTLFEEDPGIMSEAETASTSSRSRKDPKPELPVVRTPSKTLERPLGVVYLIYRGETKRALLPNEITSIITVKALFVRSFTKVLTLDYMDLPRVKIYVLDAPKDVFFELKDLGDVRDKAVLKVFEPDSSGKGPDGLGLAGLPPITNADEEIMGHDFDPAADKSRTARAQPSGLPAYRSLPRNAFSNADPSAGMVPPESILKVPNNHSGDRSKTLGTGFLRGHRGAAASGRVESGYISSPDGHFEFDHHQQANGGPSSLPARIPHASRFSSTAAHHHHEASRYYPGPSSTEEAKARMMHMEAQLSQLTGLVEKALKNKRLHGGKKQVSFDKSVTFSDEQPPSILTTSKRHQSQKQAAEEVEKLLKQHAKGVLPAAELYKELKRLHRNARELKQEVRVLRRLTQLQSMAMKDLVQDTYLKLREACISFSSQNGLMSSAENLEHWRIAQDEETFSRELSELLASISDLEARVEEVRSGVINKKNKILIQDVESMALILSQCSKSVTQLRQAFPTLEANLKVSASSGDKSVSGGEAGLMGEFLKRSSERLDSAWKRCKKLTGTLVTLKRLASVQEQRFHPVGNASAGGAHSNMSLSPTPNEMARMTAASTSKVQKESTLDDLLNALQNYTTTAASASGQHHQVDKEPTSQQSSTSSTSNVKALKPQVPLPDMPTTASGAPVATVSPLKKPMANGVSKPPPPCPPPRTTTAIPTSSSSTSSTSAYPTPPVKAIPPPPPPRTSSSSSSSSQKASASTESSSAAPSDPPAVAPKPDVKPDVLEIRHQELLSRQKMLQEQYQRLQEMQKKNKGAAGSATEHASTAAATDDARGNGGLVLATSSSESHGEFLKQRQKSAECPSISPTITLKPEANTQQSLGQT